MSHTIEEKKKKIEKKNKKKIKFEHPYTEISRGIKVETELKFVISHSFS